MTIEEKKEKREERGSGVRDKPPRGGERTRRGFRFACRTVKLLLVSRVAQLVLFLLFLDNLYDDHEELKTELVSCFT